VVPKKSKDPNRYLSAWLERYRQTSVVAPEVRKIYEYQEWKQWTLVKRLGTPPGTGEGRAGEKIRFKLAVY
jgi:hypothetical protein